MLRCTSHSSARRNRAQPVFGEILSSCRGYPSRSLSWLRLPPNFSEDLTSPFSSRGMRSTLPQSSWIVRLRRRSQFQSRSISRQRSEVLTQHLVATDRDRSYLAPRYLFAFAYGPIH